MEKYGYKPQEGLFNFLSAYFYSYALF